jgi:hypothetical protein
LAKKPARNQKMHWRSSFGATVLLALVALHWSPLIGLASSETTVAGDGREQSNGPSTRLGFPEALSKLNAMLEYNIREFPVQGGANVDMIEMVDLFSSVQPDKDYCSNKTLIEQARYAIRYLTYREPDGYIYKIVTNQLDICVKELEEQFEREFESLNESTREHFESFVKEDHSKHDLFRLSKNALVDKLRRLIGSAEGTEVGHPEIGRGFLDACAETTDRLAGLMRVREDYKSYTIVSKEYWPHIRFCDFCQALIGLDLVKQLDWAHKRMVSRVGAIFRDLGEQGAETTSNEREKSDGQREGSVVEAAIKLAEAYLNAKLHYERFQFQSALYNLENNCELALMSADDFILMHEIKGGGELEPSVEQKLGYIKECEAYVKLGPKTLVERVKKAAAAGQRNELIAKVTSCFGKSKRD